MHVGNVEYGSVRLLRNAKIVGCKPLPTALYCHSQATMIYSAHLQFLHRGKVTVNLGTELLSLNHPT